jgi:cytidylate kinase
MPLIAMTREMGSLGMDVAKRLESELGVPIVYHEIIGGLADKMRLRNSHVVRLLSGKAGLLERLTADTTSLSIFTEVELLQQASRGVILRGWGAAQALRSVRHAIRVRVCAPFELRVERMMKRLNTDDRAAVEKEIRLSDEAQGAIIKRHFDEHWQHAENYDLALNTERMSVDECADEIVKLAKAPAFRETEDSRAALSDRLLEARIRVALRTDPSTAKMPISVAVSGGKATLHGALARTDEASKALKVAGNVPGVASVINQLGSLSGSTDGRGM